ncbi:DNA helicase Pif1-like, partial [Dillenia turbinata]
ELLHYFCHKVGLHIVDLTFPIEILENSICEIKHNTNLTELMYEASLIIWDEALTMQKYAFQALDKTLRDIIEYKHPERSYLWDFYQLFLLTKSMIVNELNSNAQVDQRKNHFNKWLSDIGDGKIEAINREGANFPTWIKIPDNFLIKQWSSLIETIVQVTYPHFRSKQYNEEYLKERAILAPLNKDVEQVNDFMFDILSDSARTYKSSDVICKSLEQEGIYLIEFLNSLTFPGFPRHELNLKEGMPMMLLKYVNPFLGMCNGTSFIIT